MIKIDAALFIFLVQCLLVSIGVSVYLWRRRNRPDDKEGAAPFDLDKLKTFLNDKIQSTMENIETHGSLAADTNRADEKSLSSARLFFLRSILAAIEDDDKAGDKPPDHFNHLIVDNFDMAVREITKNPPQNISGETETVDQWREKAKKAELEKLIAEKNFRKLKAKIATERQEIDETTMNLRKQLAEYSAYKEIFEDLVEKLSFFIRMNNRLKELLEKKSVQTDEDKKCIANINKGNKYLQKSIALIRRGMTGQKEDVEALLDTVPDLAPMKQPAAIPEEPTPETPKVQIFIHSIRKLEHEKAELLRKYDEALAEAKETKERLNATISSLRKKLIDVSTFRNAVEDSLEALKLIQESNVRLKKLLDRKDLKTEELQKMLEDLAQNNQQLELCIDVLRKDNKNLKDVIENIQGVDEIFTDMPESCTLESGEKPGENREDLLQKNEELANKNKILEKEIQSLTEFNDKIQGDYHTLQKEYLSVYKELKKYEISQKMNKI